MKLINISEEEKAMVLKAMSGNMIISFNDSEYAGSRNYDCEYFGNKYNIDEFFEKIINIRKYEQ